MDAVPEQEPETVTEQQVRVRRSPRYARFMIVGAVFFVIVAFVLTYSLPQGSGYDRNGVFGYMALVGIAVGVTLGAVIALVLDRIASRRAATVAADRVDVREVVVDEALDTDGDAPAPAPDADTPDAPPASDPKP